MKPGYHRISYPRGTTYSAELEYSIDDIPVDLFGYGARMQVREFHYSPEPVMSFDTSSGSVLTISASAGIVAIDILPEYSVGVPVGEYVYDLEIYTGVNKYSLIEGPFVLTPEVTRDA